MKKTFQRIGVISAVLLALSITVNAQWTRNGGSGVTYLTNSADKVGIGTQAPSYSLDIKQDANCSFRVQSKVNGSSNLILSRSLTSTNCLVNYKTGLSDLWFTGCINNNDFRIRNASSFDVLYANQAGNIGIGTNTPATRLAVANSSLGGIATTGSFQIGENNDYNLVLDNNEVQARANGAGSPLYLQFWGGNLDACSAGGTASFHGPVNTTANLTSLGRLGVGTATPSYLVDVQGATVSPTFYNINSQTNYVGNSDIRAFKGYSHPADGYGYGGEFYGGYYGIYSTCAAGTYAFGVGAYGSASGTTGTMYGVYGNASGGTTNYAVYASGITYSTGGYQSSDAKLKKDVKSIDNALEKIMQLQPRTYNFKTDEYNYMGLPAEPHYGFIAQELETVFPAMVKEMQQPIENDYKKNGMLTFKAINYTEMIPVLTQAIQEQQVQIEAKDLKIAEQQKQLDAVNARLDKVEKSLSQCCSNYSSETEKQATSIATSAAQLFQNSPNPFNQTTVISYSLNNENNSGRIIIRDLNGNLVKQISIANSGKGQVTINANELTQGTYTYTLEIAGKSFDTKLMVVTK